MKQFKRTLIAGVTLCVLSTVAVADQAAVPGPAPATAPPPVSTAPPVMGMGLRSVAFDHGGVIPDKYSQAVPQPVSPPLSWSDVPAGVKSFALICEDLDAAPNRSPVGTLHWLVFNIPGESRMLKEAQPAVPVLPDGTVQGLNQGNVVGWRGPGARWPGPHHNYAFVLYALDKKLDLGPEATHAQVLEAMKGHVIAKAATVGRFHRKN